MAQTLDFVVDRAVFLDVRIRVRDVRFGLVVIEIRDEVLDRVVRKKVPEFGAQLRGERLVVAEHERGPLNEFDDPGHRDRLARARDAEQRLGGVAPQETRRELVGCSRLVARERIRRDEFETVVHQYAA